MFKTLVILHGLPRGGKKTWRSIFKNLQLSTQTDFALCTNFEEIKKFPYKEKCKYIWGFEEPSDWFSYYENNFNNNWREVFELGKDTGLKNSGIIHFALKDIVLKNYLEILKTYDQIIYTRFDQLLIYKENFTDVNKIYIPEGEDYFGICDRFVAFPSEISETFFNICDFVDNEIIKLNLPEYLNCESVYSLQLKNSNLDELIVRYPRNMFTSSKFNDHTNWRKPEYKLYFFNDLYLKYPQEFLNSMNNFFKLSVTNILKSFSLRFVLNYLYLTLRIKLGKVKKFLIQKVS